MKAQFKYAFLAGLYFRGPVFAVIFLMNTVFVILGFAGVLPLAAQITAVSLSGVAIAVMTAGCIIGDIHIGRRMFASPESYLHALTPVPRWKTLLAGIVTMTVLDILTMLFTIFTQVCISLNLAGKTATQAIEDFFRSNPETISYIFLMALLLTALYFLTLMIIMFCITMKKSVFFKIPASGLLAFLTACACVYVASLLQLLIAPFSYVQRYMFLIIITPVSGIALPLLIVLTLLEAAGLFILTSKLMERRINL